MTLQYKLNAIKYTIDSHKLNIQIDQAKSGLALLIGYRNKTCMI
jgi:hypothetical protein